MGWFENQIEERHLLDRQLLEEAYDEVISSILGDIEALEIRDEKIVTKTALDEICKYYHYKTVQVPEEIEDIGEELDYVLRSRGLMKRKIKLPSNAGWYRDAIGPVLAYTKEDSIPVALIPAKLMGYIFTNPYSGKRERVSKKNVELFASEGYCFYKPLPNKRLGIPDLLSFMKGSIAPSDVLFIMLCTLAVTLVGMLLPQVTKALTGPVLSSRQPSALVGIAIAMVCITISSQLLSSAGDLLKSRINTKTSTGVQSAMMMRLMTMPTAFYRKYSPGELSSRSMAVNQLCQAVVDIAMDTSLTAVASLLYVKLIFDFAPPLTIPALLIVLATVGFSILTSLVQMDVDRKLMDRQVKTDGLSYQFISGVKKIKLSGSETRSFAKWLEAYARQTKWQYNPPLFIKLNAVISTGINLFATIILYYISARSGTAQSDYYAFTAAYGMLMGAFNSLSGVALSVARIKPVLEMATPFLETAPESVEGKQIVNDISGAVKLENITFRYNEDSPYIFKNLSLSVEPGDYIALVGKTGCGKSTLVRLLIGFEHPEKGAVYYDGQNIDSLDLPSLRRKIGTVMQDASLVQGDIFSNIVITSPSLFMEDAWEAAETAQIADDIRDMPLGMNTLISEGQGGISGGQRQRLMIARAIVTKPKLLIFDEATSALDNRTQKQISEALDNMGCTRIVVAHRLSTIKHCNRILVLKDGEIIEDGKYDELMAKNGYFAELVARQRLDDAE